ncbi:MAG: SufD family Fe-S cluster assembly protein [Candidatus Peribacteraceae bacterium]|nr:SufD family Fe-S cluster assembly protein [Candidatus Peribacteraceae bacterium]
MKKADELRQIMVAAGECPSSPIELMLTGTESQAEVRIGRGAKAVICDVSTSLQHNVNVTLEPESQLLYVSLSAGSARTFRSTVAEGASIHWHCTTLGNADTHSLISTCIGANAVSNVDWIFAVRGKEKQSVNVRNVFAARRGGGEIMLKGVAEQHALAVCNGMIEITEQGTGTDTYLTEDVLMLDATAKVDAIPGLEIRTNDVKASHSATVSRVTAEDLFYLQSRGIDGTVARTMFVDGFLSDLTNSIPDEILKGRVLSVLAGAL